MNEPHPPTPGRRSRDRHATPPHDRPTPARWLRLGVPALALLAAGAWLADFPTARPALALLLLAALAVVAWSPPALLTLAAAALPVLDLAPWSGRWLLDEYDLLLLLGCSMAWARLPPRRGARVGDPAGLALAFGAVLLALAIATTRSLWTLPAWDANAWANPLSPLNGARIAKGALWAALLWWLARRMVAAGHDAGAAFGRGMVIGLAGTVAAVLVERLAFSYLLDFAGDYRISGPISAMSLGGAYIECFIAVATPFLLVRVLPPAPPWQMAAGATLLAGASYALMVTFSRGGYAAMALAVGITLAGMLTAPTRRWRQAIAGLAMAGLAAAVAWPIFTGSFARQRMETVSADIGIREQHWAQGLQVMDHDAVTQLFGMGLGRVPELFLWRATTGPRAGGHQLVADAEGRTMLRLGSGYAYFVEQVVDVAPGSSLLLDYRVQAPGASAEGALFVRLCQKWIIASFDCAAAAETTRTAEAGGWTHVRQRLTAPAAGPGRLARPTRLSIVNEGSAPATVAQLSLATADGEPLLRNADFAHGMDHWTWTSDHHLAWHTKSLPLGLYVEQGLFGLASGMLLLLLAALAAARGARAGRPDAAAMLAALCAFVTVGLIDTLLDVPRFLMLWLLLCMLPGLAPGSGAAGTGRAARERRAPREDRLTAP